MNSSFGKRNFNYFTQSFCQRCFSVYEKGNAGGFFFSYELDDWLREDISRQLFDQRPTKYLETFYTQWLHTKYYEANTVWFAFVVMLKRKVEILMHLPYPCRFSIYWLSKCMYVFVHVFVCVYVCVNTCLYVCVCGLIISKLSCMPIILIIIIKTFEKSFNTRKRNMETFLSLLQVSLNGDHSCSQYLAF